MVRIALSFAALALAFGCAQLSGGGGDDVARKDVVVSFDQTGVQPRTSRVIEGGSVAFSNRSGWAATVRLPMSDASKFECKELRPNFMKTATGLESVPIRGDAPNITLPCSLKKGTYPFKIALFRQLENMDNPQLTLDGELVVE